MSKLRVLVGCEFSGIVRDVFARKGHEAWSCDLLPSESPGNHHRGDLFEFLQRGDHWDLMIFHWPCTYMLLSGVRWFTTIPKVPRPGVLYGAERHAAMVCDANAFKRLLEWPAIDRICGEAQQIIGQKWAQHVQPWQFGHGEIKATYFWLKNLPPLRHTNYAMGREARVHKCSPGPLRWKERSRFFTGIAAAMAEQWSAFPSLPLSE